MLRLRIKKERLIIFLLLIPIFQPKLFTQISILSNIYILLNVFAFSYLIYSIIQERGKLPLIIGIWFFYRIYLLFIGILNGNLTGIFQWGYLSIMVTSLMLIFELYGFSEFIKIIKYISLISILLLALNYFTLLKFPRGIIRSTFYEVEAGDYYLLGIKTQFTTMMFPALASSGLYASIKRNFESILLFVSSILCCLLNIFNKEISTAIVGIFICLGLIGISLIFKFKYNEWVSLIAACSLHILVVFFRIQDLLASFIVKVLHKDTTMSSRVNIWDSAINLLNNQNILKLLFGNGIFKNQAFVPFGAGFWQPHNQMLALIYSSGVFGTVIFLIFIFLLLRIRTNLDGLQFLVMICMCVLFLSITEVYFDVAFSYIPFILIFYYQKYQNEVKVSLQQF